MLQFYNFLALRTITYYTRREDRLVPIVFYFRAFIIDSICKNPQ